MKKRNCKYVSFFCIFMMLVNSFVYADFRFIAMADSRGSINGVNVDELKKILGTIRTLEPQPAFAVVSGDLINGYTPYYTDNILQFTTWKETVTAFYPPEFFYVGVGNHDTGDADSSSTAEIAFKDVFSEFRAVEFLPGYNKTVYYFDFQDSRFFMLNSNHPGGNHTIDPVQRHFLESHLNGKKKYFVFCHEPAFPTGNHVGSSLDIYPAERDLFWSILDRENIDMFFVGHEHFYSRRHVDSANNPEFINSIYQLTTGTCGAPIYSAYLSTLNVDVPPVAEYHFAVVDVSSTQTLVTVYNDEMTTTIDTFNVPQKDRTRTGMVLH